MASPEREAERPLENFLEQYKRDQLQDCVRSLEEYLGLFPGDDEKVSRAYAALSEPAVTLPASGVELAAPDLLSPDRIQFGDYKIIDEIGRGGQGVVYRALDENLGRVVALKVLRSVGRNSDKAVRRFKREAEVAAKLQHAGICAVHDAGVLDGVPYIAMQFVAGESLSTRIAASRQTEHSELSTQMTQRVDGGDSGSDDRSSSHSSGSAPSDRRDIMDVVELIERAARALHVAHEAGVIHRDIKPGNLMITPDDQPVILDFGMAREIESGEQDLTRSGDLFGTPAYMSPEQLAANRVPIDRRTDVYSLGVTLYECLTNERPFKAHSREALYQAILTKEPRDIVMLNGSVPFDLRVVTATAMEKDQDRRYLTALDFAEDLRAVREMRPIAARPISRLGRLTRWARRRPALAAVIALLVIGLPTVAAMAGYILASQPAIVAQEKRDLLERVEARLALGYQELGEGNAGRARAFFEQALGLDATSPAALAGLVLALLRERSAEEALTVLDAHAALEGKRPGLRRLRVDALEALGRGGEAGKLEKVTSSSRDAMDYFLSGSRAMARGHGSGSPETWSKAWSALLHAVVNSREARPLFCFELAHAAGHLGKPTAATMASNALTETCPPTATAAYWKAFALQDVDTAGALGACLEAIELDPDIALAWNLLGNLQRREKRYEESRKAFEKAIELDPELVTPWYNLGLLYRRQGKLEEAVAAYKKAIDVDPTYPKAWNNLGAAYQKLRRHEDALAAWTKLMELRPNSGKSHANRGLALVGLLRYRDAIASFKKAASLEAHPRTYYHLGNALRRSGQDEEAVTAWRKGLESKPDKKTGASLAYNLGNALFSLERYEESRVAYLQALGYRPDHLGAQNNLGNALRELNRPAESARAYLEALTMRPDNEDLGDNVCTALKDCTDHKLRLKILARAAKVTNEQHPRILLGLARALFDGGQKEEAQTVARKALPMIAERFDSTLEAEAKALMAALEADQ